MHTDWNPLSDEHSHGLAAALRARLDARVHPDGPAAVIEPPAVKSLTPEAERLLDQAASARLRRLFEHP